MARPLSDESISVLEKLAELGEIYYITARKEPLRLVTEKFLRKTSTL